MLYKLFAWEGYLMRKIDDKKGIYHGFVLSVLMGAAVGFLLVLVLFAIFSAFISSGKLSDNLMEYIMVFAAFAGAVTGSVVAVKRHKARVVTVGISVGAVMFLVTLLGASFSEKGGILNSLTPALLLALVIGGVVGALLCLRRKKHKRA
jgi:putative membrane protein (TIGR04086 family)